MDHTRYGNIRWKIYGGTNLGPTETKALHELYGVIRHYLPYTVTVCMGPEDVTADDNIIYVGTLESNDQIAKLAAEGAFEPETRTEGYSIKVMPAIHRPERTDIIIQGADPVGALYGVFEFEHAYLDTKLKYNGYHYNRKHQILVDPCVDFEIKSAPDIKNRGLWTWGHVIYDYKGYIDNMARCRMNMLIMWNDFVPLNAREIIDYAHASGIKVIWGYSCAWNDGSNSTAPAEPGFAELWGKKVLETYEREYKDLDIDGVYFQAFTETTHMEINGIPIARLVTDFINHVVAVLHEKYPDLYIQFGLHASSIKQNYVMMDNFTNGATPVWEDCGAFPYDYDSRRGDIPSTQKYTEQLVAQAQATGNNFGVVLKGFSVLNWKEFEHHRGRLVVGVSDKVAMKKRLEDKQFYWKFAEPYWIAHADALQDFCKTVADANLDDSTVTALVEDGVFEAEIPPSVALYAELMWDSKANIKELLEKVYHSEHFGH